jgi:hypothetical protein
MADLVNRVTTLFKADTSAAKAAVKELRGAERDRAKELLDNLDKENASLQKSIAMWGKVAIGVTAVYAGFKGLQASAQSALEDIRLRSAAAGISIDKLRASTRGLVEEDKLLEFAGRTQAGMWKLTEAEMQRALKGADAIAKKTGQELVPVLDRLSMALAKGATEELKEFGVQAKDKQGVLKELDAIWRSLGGNTARAGDEFRQAGVKSADAMDKFKDSIGGMVLALGPAILKLAQFIELVSRGITSLAEDLSGGRDDMFTGSHAVAADIQTRQKILKLRELARGGDNRAKAVLAPLEATIGAGRVGDEQLEAEINNLRRKVANDALKRVQAINDSWFAEMAGAVAQANFQLATTAPAKLKAGARGGGAGGGDFAGDPIGFGSEIYSAFKAVIPDFAAAIGKTFEEARDYGTRTLGGPEDQADTKRIRETLAGAKQDAEEMQREAHAEKLIALQKEAAERDNLWRSIFGRPEEVNLMTDAIWLAGAAVDGLARSTAAAFEAAVTGSDSAIGAFKKVAGAAVHSIGMQLAIEGAKEAIMAIVSLAALNPYKAGLHAAASGAAFAGSAAAFVTANALGYGGSKPSMPSAGSARAGGPSAAGGGRAAAGEQTNQVTVMLGSDFGMLTSLEQKQLLHSAIRLGMQRGGHTNGIRRG